MKIKIPVLLSLLFLLSVGCNQKSNPCKYIDTDGSLLKLTVLKYFENKVQKTFTGANMQVSINAQIGNERLDTTAQINHYKADLITNYYNQSMSQYSLATLEIYCDSIARTSSKPISKLEFNELLE